MVNNHFLAAAVVIAMASGSAAAGALYKCTSGGTISYGDLPCPDGESITLAVPAAPHQTPQDAARLARERQHERGQMLKLEQARQKEQDREQARRAAQQESDGRRDARAAAAQQKKCAKLRLDGKWAAEDLRAAAETGRAAAAVKARRTAEKLALECPG